MPHRRFAGTEPESVYFYITDGWATIRPELREQTIPSSVIALPLLAPLELSSLQRGELRGYGSVAYSSFAFMRIGMSGSASFQRVRKSL
jgi:hypothetical protein